MPPHKTRRILLLSCMLLFANHAYSGMFDAGLPAGWSCVPAGSNCGTDTADGGVTLAPGGGTQYGYVST